MSTVRPATLYDVAEQAGVSLATASRVLNGSARIVAEDYRVRVTAAAEALGYHPNRSAQATARGTAAIVALLVADIADPFFSSIAAGVTREAERHGLLVTIAETDRDADREHDLIQQLRGIRPRLLVLAGSRFHHEPGHDRLVAQLRGVGGDVVLVGQTELPFGAVRIENRRGAEALARELVATGHRTSAVLAGPEGLIAAVERVEGFVEGLRAAGAPEPLAVLHGAFDRDGGYEAAHRYAASGMRADVLFAVNDVMAIGAMTALREAGVDVPGTTGVAGFDDIASALDAVPALTTVRIELEEAGERAVRLGLEGGDGVALGTRVVLRGSTARR